MYRDFVFCLLAALCLFSIGSLSQCLGADGKARAGKVPAAKKVTAQEDAIAEARKVDIPLLKRADTVVIQAMAPALQGKSKILSDAKAIEELRTALKPSVRQPSGSMTVATVSFYQGKTLLRKIWVYEGGEWGFDRPGTKWTTGGDVRLWNLIQADLR